MKKLNNFQEYLMITLLSNINEGLKLRKKYTKTFDKAFEFLFGTSFGIEIEIDPHFFKKNTFYWIEFVRDNIRPRIIEQQINKFCANTIGKQLYYCLAYRDGTANEITFPVTINNLHLINHCLIKLDKQLKQKLNTNGDHSSSMHITQDTNLNKNIHNFDPLHPEEYYRTILLDINENYKFYGSTDYSIPWKVKGLITGLCSKFNSNGCNIRTSYNIPTFLWSEIRFYSGTTDLRLILLRAMHIHATKHLIWNDDYERINFFTKAYIQTSYLH